ncbi:putative zinc finger [Lyophyllum shimeji]|uniref:Zinc finger n=1 Tax=Lyophyllum shimeji TaxID=47721 RepID=A0A9P3Q1W5_LYOSH|nr:putative zinc finger [Lyophyllum shimeji]
MPATESSSHPDDRDRDRDIDRSERGADRGGGSRQKSSTTSNSKSSKDLSHVPCKFFKVGGCTAGSSCPFSHVLPEPGGQKETCAWFVKGNCKFGHKCALAHILPGQSMAMDRKNKKAAQVAAQAAAAGERGERGGGKEGKGARGGNVKRDGHAPSSGAAGNRNPLLAGGSTAPTRIASSTPTGRPPMSMPLKATLSPSAPAPPLASFGVLDDLEGELATAPAQGKQASQDGTAITTTTTTTTTASVDTSTTTSAEAEQGASKPKSPEPLPASAPRPAAAPAKPSQDFGPIGSPPSSVSRPNGTTFSPGTSPQKLNGISVVGPSDHAHNNNNNNSNSNNFLSSSPFSAPGAQSVFLSGAASYNGAGAGGMAASLGSGLAMIGGGRKAWGGTGESGSIGTGTGGFGGMVPSSVHQRMNGAKGGEFDPGFEYEEYGGANNKSKRAALGMGLGRRAPPADVAVEDEDLEDFLPSSLTDLLTPEERSRRMSRSNSGQGPATALGAPGAGAGLAAGEMRAGAGAGAGMGLGHRYSRSVPAPSLLGDIKSIWAENNNANPLPSSPPTHRGTPSSSFMPRFDGASLGHGGAGGEDMLSMSMGSASSGMMGLSPSNASAAFLPGLHSHYLTSKAKQAQAQQLGLGGLARGVRGTSGPLNLASNYLLGAGAGAGSAHSGSPSGNQLHTHTNTQTNTQHTYRTTPSPFDLTQHQHQHQHLHPQPHTARPIPSGAAANKANPDEGTHLLSPSARALQAHAPGQSLPQGLAAGYSRIHALPPPPSLASPGSASIFGGGTPPTTDSAAANAGIPSSGPYGGWKTTATGGAAASPPASGAGGLDAMFSRLSYSAAAVSRTGTGTGTTATTTAPPTTTTAAGAGNAGPPGLTRNVSGGRYAQPLSPLSGPVVSRDDDDDLFSMDG